MAKKTRVEDVEDALDRGPKEPEKPLRVEDALSTSSTILNLALSGMIEGGFFPKRCYRFIGKSGSGKTWLTLSCFAEACKNKRFAKHRLIHDNPEDGALMDKTKYFGPEVWRRIEPPAGSIKKPIHSKTVEDYYYNMDKLFKAGDPFIAVLDSMDALSSTADEAKKKELYKARETGKDVTGSYGTAKARANSAGLRDIEAQLRDSDSIVIIISHAKVNIGYDAMFKPETYSGGLALKYFAHAEMWTSIGGQITRTVRGQKRKIGQTVRIKIDKNRQTGHEGHIIELPILREYGIDDLNSCIDYLINERHWEYNTKKSTIVASEFTDEPIKPWDLVKLIEAENLEDDLRMLVSEVWHAIEEEAKPKRKKRY